MPHAPTARHVPAPEVEHTVRFLDGPAGELFCSIHAPIAGAHAILVMCPPLLADHPFSYRREVLLALELARRGVAVWRFHYAGTGHSEGSPDAVSFDSIVADAAFVVEAARSAAAVPVTVGGTRFGAVVAATVAGDGALVLWEPVADGSAFLREGFRARTIADGGQLRRKPTASSELLAELRRAGRIDLLGYSLCEQLHDSMAGRTLRDVAAAGRGRVLLIDSRTADGAEPSDNLADELRRLGRAVTTATVGISEGWWFHRTQQSDHAAVAADLANVIGPWVPCCQAPATVAAPPPRGRQACDFIEVGEGAVFGLLTPPSTTSRGEAALLLWGGGGMPAFGRNQVATTLARRLAGRGYHVLQLDYPGRGDSPGSEPSDPIGEADKLEVFAAARAAYRWLESRGLRRVLTIGSCQGAVTGLNTAHAAPVLTGLALLAPAIAERFEAEGGEAEPCGVLLPMHPRIRSSFDAVVRAGTPLLLAYGVHDEGFRSFRAAMDSELGLMLRPAGDLLTLNVTEERIHGYMTVSGQEATIELVMAWVEQLGS